MPERAIVEASLEVLLAPGAVASRLPEAVEPVVVRVTRAASTMMLGVGRPV